MTRLTLKRLQAMRAAVGSMLAGEVGEGDSQGIDPKDLQAARDWLDEQIAERERRATVFSS